ncbi:hypothetical protein FC83_GL000724 [Agrilactobacillus composti DSM 18527 = JCM 14202]|uniref:DUF4828 domain-containing protein n=1 Tax=Agrilactobacillus composti DSM 18527 = JCM 14202 TaxID=1423734 RepID=X0QP22_9LACO|nr:DUF4828 domain-containing protein [Agrilactobacillus composti]KRM31432.1 hypothetical protein FC83_GL000724 [Agrilactobacillus composti DSM 18527 = JCM 14202]GAF40380.1 hypothetical protein JCM14202_2276 [Agrilactobacillus composti DSM 18527 = JCM 14202]
MADLFKHSIRWLNDRSQRRKIKRHAKVVENVEPDFSTIFQGKWAFVDPHTKKEHHMVINEQLKIVIDGKLLDGHIIGLSSDLLTFLDHYGFQLKIFAQDFHPAKIYDESSGETYEISDKN